MAFILWLLIVLSPTLIVAVLGIRALRCGDSQREADLRDITRLLSWIITALAILVLPILTRVDSLTPLQQAFTCFTPLFVFHLIQSLFMILVQRRRHSISASYCVKTVVVLVGQALGVGCYLILSTFWSESFSLVPTIWLFISLYVSSLVGMMVMARIVGFRIKPQRLAPCELASRVAEIAAAHQVKNRVVYILKSASFMASNAVAFSASGIGIGEELLRGLNKREVDAVIEHEIAHCADENLWTLRQAIKGISIIAFAAAALVSDRYIAGIGNPIGLRDIHWLMLFVLPPLASAGYSRYSERKANTAIATTDLPAVISGFYKLHVLNNLPISRPWLSRVISTHHYFDEELKLFADQAVLATIDLDGIRRAAESELKSDTVDHYEPVYYQENKDVLVKRPNVAKKALYFTLVAIVVIGFVCLCASAIGDLGSGEGLWLIPVTLIGGSALLITAIALYARVSTKRMRKQAISVLINKYSLEPGPEALLVDILTMSNMDKQIWQAALMVSGENEIKLLTECGDVSISLSGKVTGTKWVSNGGSAHETQSIAIWYQSGGVAQWVVVRNLGKPERGLPRSAKQLLQHFERLVENSGGKLCDPEELPTNKRRKMIWSWRIPVAILTTIVVGAGAFWGLVISDKVDSSGYFWVMFLVISTVWSGLWSWARAASKKGSKRADRSNLEEAEH